MNGYNCTINDIDAKISELMDMRFKCLKAESVQGKASSSLLNILKNAKNNNFYSSDNSNIRIACQGVNGAFSSMACDKLFPKAKSIMFCKDFDSVFDAVENGSVDAGVIPIENSTSGSVIGVYNLMRKHHFFISRAVLFDIRHCLLAKNNVDIYKITDIYSHEQALSQCGDFLAQYPHINIHPYSNTAAAARMVAESDDNIAAIASEKCADLYGLNILEKDIQNTATNRTVFVCITKRMYIDKKADRISVCLTLPHKMGSLSELLNMFYIAKLNLLKIESRPLPDKDFEFLFYFDFAGNIEDEKTVSLLLYLNDTLEYFEFLGNYYCE